MEKVLEYFTSVIASDNYQEVPADIVLRINELDRAERGDLKGHLFNEAKRFGLNGNSHQSIVWLEHAFESIEKHTFRYHQVLFSPGKDIPETLSFLIDRAVKSVDLCVFTISDHRLGEKLTEAHQRGVQVRIISDDQKMNDRGSQVSLLDMAGIPVRIDHSRYHMHHKFGIIDGRIAFSGSYNWTYTATKHNQENLLVTTNYDIVHQYLEEYENLWQEMFPLR